MQQAWKSVLDPYQSLPKSKNLPANIFSFLVVWVGFSTLKTLDQYRSCFCIVVSHYDFFPLEWATTKITTGFHEFGFLDPTSEAIVCV